MILHIFAIPSHNVKIEQVIIRKWRWMGGGWGGGGRRSRREEEGEEKRKE
jgi:hypothetical protein